MELNKKTIRNVFIGVAACILFYWLLHETERVEAVFGVVKSVLAPFVAGSVLAFIINVPMRSIENKLAPVKSVKLRRVIAVLLTLAVVVLVISLVFWLLIPQVVDTANKFAEKLPGFFADVQQKVVDFLDDNPELMEWVVSNTDFTSVDFAGLIQKVIDMLGNSVATIVKEAFSAIGGAASGIFNAVISIMFALYCLFQKETLARQGRRLLYAFLPEKWSDNIVRVMRLSNSTFSNFLSGQCLEVCILGSMFAISMAIFRMPYIPLVSVLVAVTAFIPVVGAFVGCIFGALFILVDNPLLAVWFVVMFLVLQQIENNVIYPRVVGTSIGLPGMWVLLAVAVGGELMGAVGMFLMIPMTSVLYVLLREVTHARLANREIDDEKLIPQPPELRSRFKERRERVRKKRIKWLTKKHDNKKDKDI